MTEKIWDKPISFNEELKQRLRKPLGTLYRGDVKYDKLLASAKPLVAVGDYTYSRLVKAGLKPNVVVIDAKIERKATALPSLEGYDVVRVVNKPGMIYPEAAHAVVQAVRAGAGCIVVEGEEDLLALPAILALPNTGVVVYGQPGTGYVVVKAGEEVRRKVLEIVEIARS